MSEYIQIETEISDDGNIIYFYTNLPLTDGRCETYASQADMEIGSPIAQALTACAGIEKISIERDEMAINKAADIDWYSIVEDVSAVLKDFFL